MIMIDQTKELSKSTYLSFSDETKIKMNEFQFFLSVKESEKAEKWLRTGTNHPYYVERGSTTNFILFINEEDAVAFELRWS